MPRLDNIRRERFCREYIRTGVASRAYKASGYKASNRNTLDVCASQLLRKPKVASRISELRCQMTYKTKISLESLLFELEKDRELARRVDQPSAAIQATVMQAKLVGLMVDRKEQGAPGEFSALDADQIVAKLRAERGDAVADLLVTALSKAQAAEVQAELDDMPDAPSGAIN
jgi:phage terminase small subunit